ncbi:MAG: hypothetical protein KKG04_05280, partial [Candidatus Thermoplasmatota archaeon]|nr:hypothetical protein [Candidatus Thermoplasmatota archaeon]
YKVLTTPKNVNVDIGVAKTIINELTAEHEIFIVEMGAYKKGEIKAICDIVSPIIGILVGINEQHLALFGSLETIKRTKAELLESLPSSGLAVINKDNQSCVEAGEDSRAAKKYFSKDDTAHAHISNLIVTPREIRMLLHLGDNSSPARTRLNGQQVIPAILAASVVADHIGMTIEEITKGIGKLVPIEGTMHLRDGVNHSLIIDDHYNANPDGFLAAIDYLNLFQEKRKIIITPGMQELGTESDLHHRNVGTHAGKIADLLIITKNDFAKPLKDSAKSGGLQEQEIFINSKPSRVVKKLSEEISDDDVILVEGRVHKSILKFLLQE